MKQYIIKLVMAAISLTSIAANATPVTWEYQGQLNTVIGYTQYHVNDAFQVLVHFDTSAAETGSTSRRHSYDPSSLSFDYHIGATSWEHITYSPTFGGLIYLRDNQGNPDTGYTGPLVDGLSFQLVDSNFSAGINLILRWFDLNTLNGTNLPGSTPALTNLATNSFFAGNIANDSVQGTIDSIRVVPEPRSAALLGIGLLALIAFTVRKNAGKTAE